MASVLSWLAFARMAKVSRCISTRWRSSSTSLQLLCRDSSCFSSPERVSAKSSLCTASGSRSEPPEMLSRFRAECETSESSSSAWLAPLPRLFTTESTLSPARRPKSRSSAAIFPRQSSRRGGSSSTKRGRRPLGQPRPVGPGVPLRRRRPSCGEEATSGLPAAKAPAATSEPAAGEPREPTLCQRGRKATPSMAPERRGSPAREP
mmetsp:Transcript_78495/g.233897  ORF Transcript_78495/g.233897 Transcript_78495/m.233897 type:complete len:206 (+) Transcript_78495:1399-2016(+)